LMTHRPDAFPPAAERDIDLMLAGHTHGGQVGFAGRSILESSLPGRYLWGKYLLGQSQLYTSCGVGHWFPFRLGCPTEAPIIELKSV
jgi:predicted MPP superfamily phosphohydrolase